MRAVLTYIKNEGIKFWRCYSAVHWMTCSVNVQLHSSDTHLRGCDWQQKLTPEICWMNGILRGPTRQLKPHQNKDTHPPPSLKPCVSPPFTHTHTHNSSPSHPCSVTRHTTPTVPSMSFHPPSPRPLSIDHCPCPEPPRPGLIQRDRRLGGLGGWGEGGWLSMHVRVCTINLSKNEIWSSHYSIHVYNSNFTPRGRCSPAICLNTCWTRHDNERSVDGVHWPTGNSRHD